MTEREQPTYDGYEAFDFWPTAADALKEVLRQHEAGEPIVWTGPDRLHHSISAGCPPPSVVFSEESLAYDLEDQGRDFWDAFIMVAFQLGFHNGTVREGFRRDRYKHLGVEL